MVCQIVLLQVTKSYKFKGFQQFHSGLPFTLIKPELTQSCAKDKEGAKPFL